MSCCWIRPYVRARQSHDSAHTYTYAILTNLPTCRQRASERLYTLNIGGRFAVALRLTVVVSPGIGLAGKNINATNPGRSGPSRRSAAGNNA